MIDLNIIPKLTQRQDAVIDQLYDLVDVAYRLGMYDAADMVRNIIAVNNSKRFNKKRDNNYYNNR